VIGSFALQRRVVATYEDFPPVCATRWSPSKTRISTVTPESILAHRRSGLSRRRIRRQGAGRVHAHHATGAQPFSFARPLVSSQGAGDDARHPDRAPLHQAANFHAYTPTRFFSGTASTDSKRLRSLLQQARAPSHARRSGAARRFAEKSRSSIRRSTTPTARRNAAIW
jgi:hypothetical protein